MPKEILFLTPVFKEMIWGGHRLESEFGYEIPGEKTGECWAVSAHESGDCIIERGMEKGKKLSELWNEKRELFGNLKGEKFPLLIKIIDAKEDLSIQVHPDDAYAKKHENGSLGKNECWYILDCDRETDIIIGHNAKTKKELESMIEEGRWEELIRTKPVKKGDYFQINPGTIHAIKGGTLILEIQKNSNITYRIYDYDRLSAGKPRELHVDKSKDVITVPYVEECIERKEAYIEITGLDSKEVLVSCQNYIVQKYSIKKQLKDVQDKPFLIMSVIDGIGTIDGTPIKKGSHFILPYDYGEFMLEGKLEIISTFIP